VLHLPDMFTEIKKELDEKGSVGWEKRLIISSQAHLGLSLSFVCDVSCVRVWRSLEGLSSHRSEICDQLRD